MASYTISTAQPTGEVHEVYGTAYYVKFAEDPETYTLWYKSAPAVGTVVEGVVVNGKFKKEKKPFMNSQTNSGNYAPKKTFSAQQEDRADGMRQGMCINNAAAYLTANSKELLPASDWAEKVHNYANALYAKGDLGKETEQVQSLFDN